MRESNKNVLNYLLMAMMVLMPVLISWGNVEPVIYIRRLVLPFGLIAALFLMTRIDKEGNAPDRISLLGVGGWLLFSALSLAVAWAPSEGLGQIGYYLSLGVWFYIVYNAAGTAASSGYLMRGWMFGGLVVAAIGMLEWAGILPDLPPYEESVTSTMGNVNLLASALTISLPVFIYMALQGKGYLRGLAAAGLLMTLPLLVVCDSAGTYIGIAAGGGAALWLWLTRRLGGDRRALMITSAGAVVMVLAGLFFLSGSPLGDEYHNVSEKGALAIDAKSNSRVERLVMWKLSTEIIAENPLLGVGVGNWQFATHQKGMKGYYQGYGTRYYARPHNDWLWIGAEAGIPALLCWALLCIAALWAAAKRYLDGKDTDGLYFLLFVGIISYTVISWSSFPLERPWHAMTYLLMIALARRDFRPAIRLPQMKWIHGALAVLLCGAIVIAYARFRGDRYMYKLGQARSAQNWPGVVDAAREARWPGLYEYHPLGCLPLEWYEAFGLMSGGYDKAVVINAYERAMLRHPWHMHTLNNLASLYHETGRVREAEQYLKDAVRIYPDFEEGRLNLAKIYFSQQRWEELGQLLDSKPGITYSDMYKETEALMRRELDMRR